MSMNSNEKDSDHWIMVSVSFNQKKETVQLIIVTLKWINGKNIHVAIT